MNALSLLTLAVASTFFPPSTARQVEALDAPIFRDREHAYAHLKRLGGAAVPAVQAAHGRLSVEGRRRAGILQAAYRKQRNERWLARHDSFPWLDMIDVGRFSQMDVPDLLRPTCIPTASCSDAATVVSYYLQASGVTGPDYAQYREATRLYVLDLLEGGVSTERIEDMLQMMGPMEQRWRDAYQRQGKEKADG